jgi:primary-amine oxidase
MLTRRLLTVIFLRAGALLFTFGAVAQEQPSGSPTEKSHAGALPEGVHETFQAFPCTPDGGATRERAQTAWKVHWAATPGCGLYLQSAWFKKGPTEPWLQVLGDTRVASLLNHYDKGWPCFWEVDYNFYLDPVTADDAGPAGELLFARPTDRRPTVVKEVRDRGIMYKHPRVTRRGQTLVLWAALDAGNFRSVIEYGFQDDGTVTCRVGVSGHNYGGGFVWAPVMHEATWRVDVNLGGPEHNSVLLCEYSEPEGAKFVEARTDHTVLTEESGLDWDPRKFTTLRVINTRMKNVRGEPVGYDLLASRMGTTRHFRTKDEEATRHDFWVTRANPNEMRYQKLPEYIKDRQPIEDKDVVLWYTTPYRHEPRSEDGEMKGEQFDGATHVMWCGFELRPRNVFDRSPFYPPESKRGK